MYAHKANRIDKAIETLFDMPNYGTWPSSKTFNFVLNLLVNNKLYDTVLDVYLSATKLGFEIDACCLNIMIKGLCKRGELEGAFKVFDEFPKLGIQRNERTFCTLMHGLCEKGMVDEAFELLERMQKEKICVDVMVFNVLINGLRKKGKIDEAIEVLEVVMMRNGCYPNESSYQHVLYGLIDFKRFEEGKRVVEKMILKGFVPSYDSFKGLVLGFCREGLVEEVDWGVKGMVRMGFVPRMGMWRQIVKCVVVSKDHVLTCHTLWMWRNKESHDSNVSRPPELWRWIRKIACDYNMAMQEGRNMNRGRKSLVNIGWTPPNSGWVKINTDGARRLDGRAGCGGLIR
ncbi:pentatricopeptide repeat-containing protein mitochondrial-like, partial [Trifolium pratense]